MSSRATRLLRAATQVILRCGRAPLLREPDRDALDRYPLPTTGLCPTRFACESSVAAAATTANVADRVEERSLHIEIHREDEMFWARVKEWPGCYASGETLDELIEAVEEAIAMFVTPDEEQIVSLELKIREIEVRVGSQRPLKPSRTEVSAGPLSTPPRISSPHRDWGFGRFRRAEPAATRIASLAHRGQTG